MVNKWNIGTLRGQFWKTYPGLIRRKINGANKWPVTAPHNMQPTDTRCAWVEFVDMCHREGLISDGLAQSAVIADPVRGEDGELYE